MNKTVTHNPSIDYGITSDTILLMAWCIFWALLPMPEFRSLKEAVILLSPVFILWKHGGKWTNRYRFWNILTLTYLLFFGLTLVSQLLTIDLLRGLNQARAFHLKFAAVLFSFLFMGRKQTNVRVLMWGATAAVAVCVLFGYYAFITPESLEIWEPESPKFGLSAMGLYKNDYAAYFAFYLPMVFGFFLYHGLKSGLRSWKTLLILTLTFSTVPLLLLTKSRASQLAVVIGILVCVASAFWRYKFIRMPLLLILGFLALITVVSATSTEYGAETLHRWSKHKVFGDWNGRLRIWSRIWSDAKKHIWFGLDFSGESYRAVINFYQGEHSLYLYYLVRSGVLGLTGFLIMSLVVVVKGIHHILYTLDDREAVLFSGVLGSFIGGYLVRGTVAHYFTFFDTFIMLSLLYIWLSERETQQTS